MWRYFFLIVKLKKTNTMCKKQFLEYFSEESCKSCSSKLKADKCNEFDECSSHSFEYFKAGFEANKKEYEEKLRWIPIEEKLPPICTIVDTKYKNTYSYLFHLENGEFDNCTYNPKHWRHIL